MFVALSETDNGSKDTAISIRDRVAASAGTMVGLAGLTVGERGDNTVGTNINTNTFDPDNIRAGAYLFSRRLFLQRATDKDPTPPTGCTAGVSPPVPTCLCGGAGLPGHQLHRWIWFDNSDHGFPGGVAGETDAVLAAPRSRTVAANAGSPVSSSSSPRSRQNSRPPMIGLDRTRRK